MDDEKKQKAMAELRVILETQRRFTEAKLRQFDGFFDHDIGSNNFENAAQSKDMQGRLEHMLELINAALADMSKENVERYLKESNAFASHCEGLVAEMPD
jgi:hypothetical protein